MLKHDESTGAGRLTDCGLHRRAEVVLLVVDGQDCAPDGRLVVAQQDFRLAELLAAQGRACVLVVNKWDAVADKDNNTLAHAREELLRQLRPLSWASVVFTSAVTGTLFFFFFELDMCPDLLVSHAEVLM